MSVGTSAFSYFLSSFRLLYGRCANRYAPNLLVHPYGDWYGLLSPTQVPQILADIRTTAETRGVRPLEGTEEPVLASHELREHWRGRMGMSKEEQALLAEKIGLEMPPPST